MVRVKVQYSGFDSLRQKLLFAAKKITGTDKTRVTVVVGYESEYGVHVHENVGMALKGEPRPSGLQSYWDARKGQGTAKFLETPARLGGHELGNTVKEVMENDGSLLEGLLTAGHDLMRESKMIVPYEYGPLHDSAFVEEEGA